MPLSNDTKKRYDAFWSCDAYERCCTYLTVQEGEHLPPPSTPEQKWTDIDDRLRRTLFGLAHTRFYGDAFPSVFTNFGPGSLAASIGGSAKWAHETVWFENEPFYIEDWENPKKPVWDPNAPMSLLQEEFVAKFLAAGKDKFIVSTTDLGGTYDIVAALRGTQNLLVDLLEYPEEIKRYVVNEIEPLWKNFILDQSSRLFKAQGAYSSWMPIYSEKLYYPLQSDFSAMISPDMFKEFILPDLKWQTELLDRAIYHLDGPGEIPHVDHLLSLPRLNAIQWVPGDGKPSVTDPMWFDMYERIQRAGKGLVLFGVNIEGLENLLNHISAKGVYISSGARDINEAEEYMKIVNAKGVN